MQSENHNISNEAQQPVKKTPKRRIHGCLLAALIAIGILVVGLPLGFYIASKSLLNYTQKGFIKSPLCIAVLIGSIEDVDRLLAKGVDPNEKGTMGHSPLIVAVDHDHPLIAERLLQAGAKPNQKDNLGWAPLHHTVKPNGAKLDMITILVRYGADVNVTDNHLRTPLHRAAQFGHAQAVKLFLQLGANPSAKDENGWTPLDRGMAHPSIVDIFDSVN